MKKILVALDGSPRADEVLASAVSIAGYTGAKLVLFRAFELSQPLPIEVVAFPDDSVEDVLRQAMRDYLEGLAKRVPGEHLFGIRVDLGVPWKAVCAAAREEGVDLVVIGSHGYTGLDHLIGTTAAKIVNHVDRPLLVVRKPAS